MCNEGLVSNFTSIRNLICVLIAGLTFLGAVTINGQGQTSNRRAAQTPDRIERSEVAQVHELVFLIEPELGADTLVALAGSPHVANRSRKVELLNEALRMAERAKNPFRREIVRIPGSPVDTAAGYAHYAYEQQLDRLTLQSKAIIQLSKIDRAAARQILFEMNGRLDLKPTACTETLVYNVDSIYRAVSDVARSGFSEKEINEGDRAIFLSSWVSDLRSPAQLGPVLDLIAEFRNVDTEREILSSNFARAARDFGDDRTFTHALVTRRIISKLPPVVGGIDDGTKSPLISAFREILVKNLKGTRCRENVIDEDAAAPQFLLEFNRLSPERSIDLEQIIQSEIGAAATVERSFQSAPSARLNAELRGLRQAEPVSADSNDTLVEWQSRVQAFLEQLSSFEPPANEDGLLHFHEKAILFESLIQTVKDRKELLTPASARFLRFLDNSTIRQSNFPHWYTYVDRLPALLSTDFEKLSSTVPNNHFRLLALRRELKL